MDLGSLKVDIFYDGSDGIANYIDQVDGVTTNIGFLKKSGVSDYGKFISDTVLLNKDNKPISFQVFAKNMTQAREQALKIASFSDDIFVKIPVIGPFGESFVPLIKELVFAHDLKINVTSVYTKDQIDEVSFLNEKNNNTIVSIFCGRIGDTGHQALDIMEYAVSRFRNSNNVKTLWAGCQRVCDILSADEAGCDIITVPEGVLKKVNRLGKSLHEFSLKTSYDFYMDGSELILSVGD